MRIISISNNKGGVGKTTSTVNIAAALQMLGKKVLVIDMDHQAQTTYHLLGDSPNLIKESVYEVLKGDLSYKDILIDRDGIDLLPSSQALRGLEFIDIPAKEFLLRDAFHDIEGYDFILIDCPPSMGVLTLNALFYSQEIFIPLQVQFLPYHGMYNLFEGVQIVNKRMKTKIEVTGIIGTMYNSKKTINNEVIEETKRKLPGKLFNTLIRDNVALQEAPSWGKTIFEYKPNSTGAKDYMNLTKEILERNKKS